MRRLVPIVRLLLAVAVLVAAFDAVVFRSGLYYRFVKPASIAGSVRQAIAVARASYVPGKKNILVLGDSRIGEGFSQARANSAVGRPDLNFINVAIPGSDLRVWYYLLRRLDPGARRYAAIVLPLRYEVPPDAPREGDLRDIAAVAPLLGLRDLIDFPASFDDPEHAARARRAIVFPGQAVREDVADFLADPRARLQAVSVDGKEHVGSFIAYGGRATALPDLPLDPTTLQPTDWQGREAELKPLLSSYFEGLRTPPPSAAGSAGSATCCDWFARIAVRYRAHGVPVVVLEVPRGPWAGAALPVPRIGARLAGLVAAGTVTPLPPDSFIDLERPSFFFDPLHMNRAGRERFSPRLAQLVAAIIP